MKRTEVLLLALLFQSAPTFSQTAAPIIHTAQTADKPPIPQTPQKPPGDDTGMTGQVATGTVVVPGVGAAVSMNAILGIAGVIGLAAVLAGAGGDGGEDSTPTSGGPTTTR